MVFSPIHFIPSPISPLLIILLARRAYHHKSLALMMALFTLLGLAGYSYGGESCVSPLVFRSFHLRG